MHLHLEDLREGYVDTLKTIRSRGVNASPGGKLTKECIGVTLEVANARDLLPVQTGRKVAVRLAATEAIQLCGGYTDPVELASVAPPVMRFADQGQFHGAYGPRIRAQLPAAVMRLLEDNESRRAVVSVWDPLRDLYTDDVKNYPCTTELQFLVRKDKLILHVTMRANDAWNGLAYDAFVFGQLQHTVANALGVEAGAYIHHAVSMHLYEEHWDKVDELVYPDVMQAPKTAVATGFGDPGYCFIEDAMGTARDIGSRVPTPFTTNSEAWYIDLVG
jgi:thymidylate synthase